MKHSYLLANIPFSEIPCVSFFSHDSHRYHWTFFYFKLWIFMYFKTTLTPKNFFKKNLTLPMDSKSIEYINKINRLITLS
jgi:uncharacterized membrane protein (DUF106 family)